MQIEFRNDHHKNAYFQMIEDMYLSEEELKLPSETLKKQMAFCYLIALFQEEYEQYEGEGFYVEVGEELSIGGPTYLLDERYGKRTRDYEKIIPIACHILKDGCLEQLDEKEKFLIKSFKYDITKFINQAVHIIKA